MFLMEAIILRNKGRSLMFDGTHKNDLDVKITYCLELFVFELEGGFRHAYFCGYKVTRFVLNRQAFCDRIFSKRRIP